MYETYLLRERAERALTGGPLSSSRLVELVCSMPRVPAQVADEIVIALLGASAQFRRDSAGNWMLLEPAAPRNATINADARLDAIKYLVIDVETTGGGPRSGDRITEIAAYQLASGKITPVIDTLVNPRRFIPAFVTSLTGISWEMVKNCQPFVAHAEALHSALDGHVFVAHNASFDWRFVSTEIEWALGRAPDPVKLCTVKLARALLPELRRRSLDHLAFHFGVEIEGRHRAGGDAHATAKVLQRLLRVAEDEGVATWGELGERMLMRSRYSGRGRRKTSRSREGK